MTWILRGASTIIFDRSPEKRMKSALKNKLLDDISN